VKRLLRLIDTLKTWFGWRKPAEKQERPDPFIRDGWTRIEDQGPPPPKPTAQLDPWERRRLERRQRLSIRQWQVRRARERWTGRL